MSLKSILCALAITSFINFPAWAEVNVVTTLKPLHSIASAIMQDTQEPTLLMRSMASPHSYKLKPSATRALNQAAIIFWLGPAMESKLAKAIKIAGKSAVVIELLKSTKIELLASRSKAGTHSHGHDLIDPHVWLSVKNAKGLAFEMKRALTAANPARSKLYQVNYLKLEAELNQLQNDIRTTLKSISDRPFIVHHDSLQYFENENQLNGRGAVMASDDQRPGAKRLSILRKLIKTENIACVFSEPQYNQKILGTLTKGSAARIETLDSLGSNLKPGPHLYPTLMRQLAQAVKNCLQ